MNIQIITSSYPATPVDASGTAGLFVREFALEVARLGHRVVVQPVARKSEYVADAGLIIDPLPWRGGDRELASMNFKNPLHWPTIGHFLRRGARATARASRRYEIDRTLCMWVVPSGVFGCLQRIRGGPPFDVWALGSDIWKIRRLPIVGTRLLRSVIARAQHVYADGLGLGRDVESIAGRSCTFLPSSRRLPPPTGTPTTARGRDDRKRLLFVGRYHPNKGPDLLVEAVRLLPESVRRSIVLEMYGLGPLRAQLESSIRRHRLDDIILLGGPIEAQDFSNALERSTYAVIPSRIESIPVVFSDALQRGRPVVAMPVGDLGELVRETDCGIVAETVSAAALSDALSRALSVDGSRFSPGVISASRQFDIRTTARRWLNSEAIEDEDRVAASRSRDAASASEAVSR